MGENNRLLIIITLSFITSGIIAQINYPYHFTYDGNPLVRIHGAADPDAHVWDDTVWVYCSQDHEIVNGDTYKTMDGYHVFSSTDMVNWTDHGEVLHSRDVSWGVDGYMWAPGAARKNGKYYLYYPHIAKEGGWRVGVAISDRPEGPFKDIGQPIAGLSGIDPAVFIDDDGLAYIYNGHYNVAKLKENMIELAEPAVNLKYAPQDVLEDDKRRFHEGPYMHKRNGIYYFSYSNFKNPNFQGWYAMADNPYGPFKWMGPMAPNPQGAQDHHSVIKFKDQWYYFYHIAIPDIPKNKKGQGRIACFDRLYYNDDGTIQLVVHTKGPTNVLKTNASNGSIILDPPGGAYAPGSKVELTASGKLGYTFESWGGDITGNDNPITIVIDGDKSIDATFKETPTSKLTLNSENGQVLLTPPGGEYNSGTVVSLTPVDDFGYDFSSWSGDIGGIKVPSKIIMDSDKTVKANFISIPTYSIATKAENGIIVLDPDGEKYEEGTKVILTAKKDFGYTFKQWNGDYTGTENPLAITMNQDKNIQAIFEESDDGIVAMAINCGGKEFRSDEGIYYKADKYSNGGGSFSTGGEISGTEDDALYNTERVGNEFKYDIPLADGNYEVTLMFSEIYFNKPNQRVFNVKIEGDQVLENFDICSKTKKNSVLEKTFVINVADSELNISFNSVKENPKISAIKIIQPD